MSEKITKEMVDTYLSLHEKITNRLEEVLSILVKTNPQRYKNVCFEYYSPEQETFLVGGWDGCRGCYDWESESVPMHYLYDEDWLEQEKQKLKEAEEEKKKEMILNEQREKEKQEQKDRKEYERLKRKYE